MAALLCSVLVLAACNDTAVLTPDGTDSFQYAIDGTTATVSAPAGNTSNNLREVFWDSQQPMATDSQACATWQADSGGIDQEGIALHITYDNNVLRAVTVTKNIFGFVPYHFNFHVWDTSQSPAYTQFGWADFGPALSIDGVIQLFPWHVCARIIGSTLETKAWLDGESEPAWDDPVQSASITVPSGWLNPGKAGWYIGHLAASETATFTDLTTSDLDAGAPAAPMTAPVQHNVTQLISKQAP